MVSVPCSYLSRWLVYVLWTCIISPKDNNDSALCFILSFMHCRIYQGGWYLIDKDSFQLNLNKLNQYFGHLMQRVDSLEKTLMLGGIEGRRRRGRQRMRWLDGITDSDGRESEWAPEAGDGQGGLAFSDSWGCKQSDATERLNWTELKLNQCPV